MGPTTMIFFRLREGDRDPCPRCNASRIAALLELVHLAGDDTQGPPTVPGLARSRVDRGSVVGTDIHVMHVTRPFRMCAWNEGCDARDPQSRQLYDKLWSVSPRRASLSEIFLWTSATVLKTPVDNLTVEGGHDWVGIGRIRRRIRRRADAAFRPIADSVISSDARSRPQS